MLHQPIKIGSLSLRHRLIQGPMWTRFASVNGEVTQQMIDYYSARAKGGVSLIVIESTTVDGRYGWPEPTLRLDSAVVQPGYGRLVEAIHLHGVPVVAQLLNVGAFSTNPISPSAVPSFKQGQTGISEPRPLSLTEIEEVRDSFIAAAVRAKQVECDGVLVHGATAYLLHHFVSPRNNLRTDKYGGSFENRIRLALELIRGIRQKCRPDFVLGYCLVCDELIPGGLDYETSIPFAKILEQEGIDYLDVSSGTYETFASTDRSPGHSKYTRFGYWEHTEVFKKEVKLPIIGRTAGDYDPFNWERLLQAGHADVIQLAKPVLCDPDLPNKVLAGNIEDVRFCTCCLHCQDKGIVGVLQPECALNPELGRERDYAIQRTPKPKRVLVVGSGPGGLEAARVAALRGHDVTLMEKQAEPGGKLKFIALCYDQEPYGAFRDWQIKQCKEAGVRFELGKEATAASVQEAKPDAVILATGAPHRIMPDIRGISKPHVVTPEDVLTGKASVGKRVVIIGGNRIGVDVAYTLVKRNLAESVTIVEPRPVPAVGYDMEVLNAAMMTMCLLPKWGVQALTGTRVEEIADGSVAVGTPQGKKQKIAADTVIVSMGYAPDRTLHEALQEEVPGIVKELYAIGDCVKTRKVRDAVHEAAFVARQI